MISWRFSVAATSRSRPRRGRRNLHELHQRLLGRSVTPLTIAAGTSYIVFAYDKSSTGDSATVSSSGFGGTPVFTPIGAQQDYNGVVEHNSAWLLSGATGTGSVTVTFQNRPATNWSYLEVVAVSGALVPLSVTSDGFALSGGSAGSTTLSNPATATLPTAPGGTDAEVIFWSADGNTTPTLTAPFTSVYGTAIASTAGSVGVFAGGATASPVSVTMNAAHAWGTIAVDIAHP